MRCGLHGSPNVNFISQLSYLDYTYGAVLTYDLILQASATAAPNLADYPGHTPMGSVAVGAEPGSHGRSQAADIEWENSCLGWYTFPDGTPSGWCRQPQSNRTGSFLSSVHGDTVAPHTPLFALFLIQSLPSVRPSSATERDATMAIREGLRRRGKQRERPGTLAVAARRIAIEMKLTRWSHARAPSL